MNRSITLHSVNWPTDKWFFATAVGIYGLSMIYSFFLWRRGFQRDDRINYLLLLAGCGFHMTAMLERGLSLARCPVGNLYEVTVFIGWTIVMAYLIFGLWRRLRFLGAFASPLLFCLGVFALFPALDVPYEDKTDFLQGWTSLHISLILLAYGAFGLSSVASVIYLSQEHDLKFNKLRAVTSLLPPIQRLDRVSIRLILTGWILLAVGLGIGFWYLEQSDETVHTVDPKIVWSLFVLLLYLVLLAMRWKFHLSGKRFAWGSVCGFLFIVLTFWGVNLLSPIHNPS